LAVDEAPTALETAPTEFPATEPATRVAFGGELASRPAPEWLDGVQGEIDDVDRVLKCLARDTATMCQTCDAAQAAGELASRPVLARCASTKQPR
jgi:hypothetical protein